VIPMMRFVKRRYSTSVGTPCQRAWRPNSFRNCVGHKSQGVHPRSAHWAMRRSPPNWPMSANHPSRPLRDPVAHDGSGASSPI
jgi:hypothetical protein